ncbi:proline--tRNA ligase [bacterium]|nr:proline--tRNA ligase [bacterium]
MRLSSYYLPTLREEPSEREIPSLRLLLKAGYIRRIAAGVYTFLPLGFSVYKKIENIVREEMNRAGGIEILMPALNPSELWEESGRWTNFGPELFKLKDRTGRDFCLAPTHEEVSVEIVRRTVKSYRQLPLLIYHIQTKFRDEPRPRGGLIRAKEFVMKDLYSFDRDDKGLDESFEKIKIAYERILQRLKLPYLVLEAEAGAIGGKYTLEFTVPTPSGEDEVILCENCGYASAKSIARIGERDTQEEDISEDTNLKKVHTPNLTTVAEVASFLGIEPKKLVKTLLYLLDGKPIAALIRGDRELSESKLALAIGAKEIRMADEETILRLTNAPMGFSGPVNLKEEVTIVADKEVAGMKGFVTGANEKDYHFLGVVPGRDFKISLVADIRVAQMGDPCPQCGEDLMEIRGIEVGHIFKLGTEYSEKMQAYFQDEDGSLKPFVMGCYGLGVSRLVSAIAEVHHDEDGLCWPPCVAPFDIILILVNSQDEEQRRVAEDIYARLSDRMSVLYDDREESPGVKFKDADLIGIPLQIVVGRKVKDGIVELRLRKNHQTEDVPIEEVEERTFAVWEKIKAE